MSTTEWNERPISFQCRGSQLLGILHESAIPSSCGVLIIVGGPQYRVGSHRQFVLLARHLADAGVPAFRFDCRGMGDSDGQVVTFEEMGADIAAAIDAFIANDHSVERIVVWGLCDAASAALINCHTDPRILGMVLLNPWVRSDATLAKTYLRHYYFGQVFDREFWRRLVGRQINFRQAFRAFSHNTRLAFGASSCAGKHADTDYSSTEIDCAFPIKMLAGMQAFRGAILIILSGDDLTALEFDQLVGASTEWQEAISSNHVTVNRLVDADHTFSRSEWRTQVATWTTNWVLLR